MSLAGPAGPLRRVRYATRRRTYLSKSRDAHFHERHDYGFRMPDAMNRHSEMLSSSSFFLYSLLLEREPDPHTASVSKLTIVRSLLSCDRYAEEATRAGLKVDADDIRRAFKPGKFFLIFFELIFMLVM
jgi:hypothetical protein